MRPEARAALPELRLATWNIHGSVGGDRLHDVERIVRVLREIDADVVALQEVTPLALEVGVLRQVRDTLGLHIAPLPTHRKRDVDYGNALLSRFPFRKVTSIDLSVSAREPRNAIDARIDVHGHELRVVATHLGLKPSERRVQVQRILAQFENAPMGPAVVMGDVNEWYLLGRPLRWLHQRFAVTRAPATFPARRPMLKLDRIWAHPARALTALAVHRSPLARIASDHLPLVARFRFQPSVGGD